MLITHAWQFRESVAFAPIEAVVSTRLSHRLMKSRPKKRGLVYRAYLLA
jgi:hypothetical protein